MVAGLLGGTVAATGSDAQDGNSFASAGPAISLPKGGGVIRGVDEKFAANPATGTVSLTIPLATTSGRSGFGSDTTNLRYPLRRLLIQ